MAYFLVNPPLFSWSFLSFTHLCLDTPFPTSFHRLFHIVFLPNLSHIASLHLCQLHFSASFPVILLIPPSPPPRHNFWLNGIQTVASCWMGRLCWHRLSPALLLYLSLSLAYTYTPIHISLSNVQEGIKGSINSAALKIYTHLRTHTLTVLRAIHSLIESHAAHLSFTHRWLLVEEREWTCLCSCMSEDTLNVSGFCFYFFGTWSWFCLHRNISVCIATVGAKDCSLSHFGRYISKS